VSPLWRDEVGIFVSPTCVVVNRMQRGLRPRCVADEFVSVDNTSTTDWAPAIAALRTLLAQVRWQGANARIVLANPWVRFAVAPWSADLTTAQERLSHAHMVLAQTFGETADDWRLTLSEGIAGQAQIICAVPALLVAEIESLLTDVRLKVLSMQPQLIVSFNNWRKTLPSDGGWFVSLESGYLAAAHFGPNGWDQIRSVRIGQDWVSELNRLRRFGRLASGDSRQSRVFVDAPYWVRKLASSREHDLEMLERSDEQAVDTLQMLATLRGLQP
jgi:hypothetical protein